MSFRDNLRKDNVQGIENLDLNKLTVCMTIMIHAHISTACKRAFLEVVPVYEVRVDDPTGVLSMVAIH